MPNVKKNRSLALIAPAVMTALFLLPVASPASAQTCCACKAPGESQITCLTADSNKLTGGARINNPCNRLPGAYGAALEGWTCERPAGLGTEECQPVSSQSPSALCQNGPTPAASLGGSDDSTAPPTPAAATPPDAPAILPNLNVEIPGFSFIRDPNPDTSSLLAQYIAGAYRWLISISAVAATIMFTWGAFLYLVGASNIVSVARGKEIMQDAVVGLILVLGAHMILRTVNPDTLTLDALNVTAIKPERALYAVGASAYSRLFGGPPPDRKKMLALAKEIAAKTEIPELPCIVYASMIHESGGRMDVIGFDSNFKSDLYVVKARKDFLASGKTYKGQTFAPITCTGASCQTASQVNDDTDTFDHLKPPDYGLDWRYSHGFGASQSTVFPNSAACPGRESEGRGFRAAGKCYNVLELMRPETNVGIMVDHFKATFLGAGKDVPKTFVAYAGQGITGGVNNPAIVSRIEAYEKCRAAE